MYLRTNSDYLPIRH